MTTSKPEVKKKRKEKNEKLLKNIFYKIIFDENLIALFHHVLKNVFFATTAAVAKSINSS